MVPFGVLEDLYEYNIILQKIINLYSECNRKSYILYVSIVIYLCYNLYVYKYSYLCVMHVHVHIIHR